MDWQLVAGYFTVKSTVFLQCSHEDTSILTGIVDKLVDSMFYSKTSTLHYDVYHNMPSTSGIFCRQDRRYSLMYGSLRCLNADVAEKIIRL